MLNQTQDVKYGRLSISVLALITSLGMFEFLSIGYVQVGLFVLFSFALVLVIFSTNSIPIIWLLLSVLYFFPYENINPLVREVEKYFSIYRRVFGPLNTWEILIIVSMAALLIQKLKKGQFIFKGIPRGPWLAILTFFLFSFFIGFLHIKGNLLSYGQTDFLRPFVAFQAILYMMIVYFITVNCFANRKQIVDTISFVKILSIVLILFGSVKGILIATGNLTTIWPFGLPIILYNQMTFLYLLIFWGVVEFFSTNKQKDFSFVWVILAVGFILVSTRRFNYFMLLAGVFVTTIFAKYYFDVPTFKILKKIMVPISFLIVFAVILMFIFPSFLESVSNSFQSINIYNLNDAQTNNDIRRAAMSNMYLNLLNRPYTFLTGFGLGTTWKAIVYQPFDTLFKNVNSEFLSNSLGWYPQFPLPYINLIFRYGALGVTLFWLLCLWLVFRFYQSLKRIKTKTLPAGFIQSAIIFILLYLTSIGDIYNPTAPILLGFLIGFLESIFDFYLPGSELDEKN